MTLSRKILAKAAISMATVQLVSVSLMNNAAAAESASLEVRNTAVVEKFLNEVVSGGKQELIDQLWAPNMVWRAASMGEVRGIEPYKEAMKAAKTSFSGMKLQILDVVAQGDKVVIRFMNSGTNIGGFFGKPATGKFTKWEGIGIYRLENGKIVEASFVEDIWGMQAGLGNITAH